MYHSARQKRDAFFIGIDPNVKPLQKISRIISRKGGVPNALFLRATVEELPEELTGLARQVHVNFPWGTLLAATMGTHSGLDQLKKVCAGSAQLNVILSFDPEKDRAEWKRLGIEMVDLESFKTRLQNVYWSAGLHSIIEYGTDPGPIQTSWSKRLQNNSKRIFLKIEAHPL